MSKFLFFTLGVFLMMSQAFSSQEGYLYLPAIFSDNMVLQQSSEVPVWGKAKPLSNVEIHATWLSNPIQIRADSSGDWMAKLKTYKATKDGKSYSLTIINNGQKIKIKNILFGEVWLASGQSNMEMPLKGWGKEGVVKNAANEIANANFPFIRMFTVEKRMSFYPVGECAGKWLPSNPKTVGDFSATAYFFARKLYQELKIPIGIIHTSWGGTPIESWISASYLKKIKSFENLIEDIKISDFEDKRLKKWLVNLTVTPLDLQDQDKKIGPFDFNDKKYSSIDFDDSNWAEVKVPGIWNSKPLENYQGVVWLRKKFELPENFNADSLKLYLNKIDEMDETYINGIKIGSHLKISDWEKTRIYNVDASVFKPGKNVLAVKITNVDGAVGIYGDRNVALICDGKEIVNLSGLWKYKIVGIIFNSNLYFFNDQYTYSNMPKLSKYPLKPTSPTVLYNAMIAPLIPFKIKGIIWYQGESNVGNAALYEKLFPLLIQNWREKWASIDLPFYYVQIAPFLYDTEDGVQAAELRWAQFLAMKTMKNVGMVVTSDIGDIKNIHPANKQEMGRRLALWALNKTYRKKNIVCSGPLFSDCQCKGKHVVINFDYVDGGLICRGKQLSYFEAAGEDGRFYPAQAKIQDDKVIVICNKVSEIKHVRFGWRDIAEPNLFNKKGLPAAAFKCESEK